MCEDRDVYLCLIKKKINACKCIQIHTFKTIIYYKGIKKYLHMQYIVRIVTKHDYRNSTHSFNLSNTIYILWSTLNGIMEIF